MLRTRRWSIVPKDLSKEVEVRLTKILSWRSCSVLVLEAKVSRHWSWFVTLSRRSSANVFLLLPTPPDSVAHQTLSVMSRERNLNANDSFLTFERPTNAWVCSDRTSKLCLEKTNPSEASLSNLEARWESKPRSLNWDYDSWNCLSTREGCKASWENQKVEAYLTSILCNRMVAQEAQTRQLEF